MADKLTKKELTEAFVEALRVYNKSPDAKKLFRKNAQYEADLNEESNQGLFGKMVGKLWTGTKVAGAAGLGSLAAHTATKVPVAPPKPEKEVGEDRQKWRQRKAEHEKELKEFNEKYTKEKLEELQEKHNKEKAEADEREKKLKAKVDREDPAAREQRTRDLIEGKGSVELGASPDQMKKRKEDLFGKDVSKTMPAKSVSWDAAVKDPALASQLDPEEQAIFDSASLDQITENYHTERQKIIDKYKDEPDFDDTVKVATDSYFNKQIALQQLDMQFEIATARLQGRKPETEPFKQEITSLAQFQDRARHRGELYRKSFFEDREKRKEAQAAYNKKQAEKKKSTGKPAEGLMSVEKGTDLGKDVGVVGASGLTESQEKELNQFAAGDAANQEALQEKYKTTQAYESALRKGNIDLYKKQKLTEAFEAGGLQDPAAEVGQVDMREVKVGPDGQLTYKGDTLGGTIGKEGSRVKTGGQKWSVQSKAKYDMPTGTVGSGAIDTKYMHDDNAAALAGAVAEQGFVPMDTSQEFLAWRSGINKVAGKDVNPGYIKEYDEKSKTWTFIVRDQVNESQGSVNLASGVEACHTQLINGFRNKEYVDYGAVMNAASAEDARVTEPGIVPTKFGFDHLKGLYLGDGIAGCVYCVYKLTPNASAMFTKLQQEKQGADEAPGDKIPEYTPYDPSKDQIKDLSGAGLYPGAKKGRVGSPIYKATKADFKGTGLTRKTLGMEAEGGIKNIGASMVTPKDQSGVDSISAERDELNKLRKENEKGEPPNPWVPPKKIDGRTNTEWVAGLEGAVGGLNKPGIQVGPVTAYFTTSNPVSQQFPKLGPKVGMEMIAPFMDGDVAVLAGSVPLYGMVSSSAGGAAPFVDLKYGGPNNAATLLQEAYTQMGIALIQNDLPNVLAVPTNYGDGKSVTFFVDLQPDHFPETKGEWTKHKGFNSQVGRVGRIWLVYKLSPEASDKIMGDKAVVEGRALVEEEMFAGKGVTLWGSKLHSTEGQEKLKAKFGDKMTAKPFQGVGGVQRGQSGITMENEASIDDQTAGDDAITRMYMAGEEMHDAEVTDAGGLSPVQRSDIQHELSQLEEKLYDEAGITGVGFDEIPSKIDARRQELTQAAKTKSAVAAGDRGKVTGTGLEQFKFPDRGGAVTDSLKLQKDTLKMPSKLTVEDEGHDKTVGAVNGVKASIDVLAGAILNTKGGQAPMVVPQPNNDAPPPENIPNAAGQIHNPNLGRMPGTD